MDNNNTKKLINFKILQDLGLVNSSSCKIKLLAKGEIKNKINIEVSATSSSARESVEKIGGSVTIVDFKKSELKKPEKSED